MLLDGPFLGMQAVSNRKHHMQMHERSDDVTYHPMLASKAIGIQAADMYDGRHVTRRAVLGQIGLPPCLLLTPA